MKLLIAAGVLLSLGGFGSVPLWAAHVPPPPKLPAGFVIAPDSWSPDRRYAVSAYDNTVDPADAEDGPNEVIDLRTGNAIGTIRAEPAAIHMNHGSVMPCRWSANGSLLLWEVSGKWCPWALSLLRLRDGRIAWQTDLLLEAQRAILERTRRADPRGYRAAMKQNQAQASPLGSHVSVYPDGFTVDVTTNAVAGRPLRLPLKVTASLTANPKGLEPYPEAANVNAHMEAGVGKDGRLRVTAFQLAGGRSRSPLGPKRLSRAGSEQAGAARTRRGRRSVRLAPLGVSEHP